MADGQLILVAGALLAAGLVASLLAVRLRVPSLVLFLGVGMAIGSDGAGWIQFNDYELARTVGIVALALILFEGGLTSGLLEIRPVLGPPVAGRGRHPPHRADHGPGGRPPVRPERPREPSGEVDRRRNRRCGDVRAAPRLDDEPEACADPQAESGLNDPVAVVLVLGFIDWIQKPGYGIGDFLGALRAGAGNRAWRRRRGPVG